MVDLPDDLRNELINEIIPAITGDDAEVPPTTYIVLFAKTR